MVETVVTVERTTTTTTGPPGGNPSGGDNGGFWSAIRINMDYYRTAPGIIKIVQFILGIICMALASPAQAAATSFFLFVVVISFIITILLIAAYFLGIREALNVAVNWIFSELLTTAVLTLLYFIAFIVQLARWAESNTKGHGSNTAAGVFGLFNFLAYAAGTYFLFLAHRSGATH
ncbi:CKLF-like MARVEL transmembrane domain-containing protein 4 [Drosophila novamexicana]|uniref:CKLF-like MARVEL transmembrane domain-containing protein 4 n=1 Tax=Drosophila novamexicana TaxID=47314 RepID=UPI0011E5D37D|nr:CKLF-like MARVEL transmembrane domain-containing protein 4 [Drosophila novamexicana]XP_030568589.1 CKLF-like MARVEL transmembrane domain-containing protein 4 [Drosophila novamexicana]XP_030568590.1 CKLF-like MARVEL transmembrane domain-containing protein 4 [Drosophila novamexicana]